MLNERKKQTRPKGAFTVEQKRQIIGLLTERGEIQELNRRLGNKSLNMGHQPWLRTDTRSKYDELIPEVVMQIVAGRVARIEKERDAYVKTMLSVPWIQERLKK